MQHVHNHPWPGVDRQRPEHLIAVEGYDPDLTDAEEAWVEFEQTTAKAAASLRALGNAARRAAEPIQTIADQMAKIPEMEWRKIENEASRVYSPMNGRRKNAAFKDRGIGKVRGR